MQQDKIEELVEDKEQLTRTKDRQFEADKEQVMCSQSLFSAVIAVICVMWI